MRMEQITRNGRGVWNTLRGLALAGLVSIALLLVMAFIMLKLQPDMGTTQAGTYLTYAASCFAGGMYCGKKAEKRKFIWGLLVGVVYFLILFLISCMGETAGALDFTKGALAFVLCAAGGMFGGMLAG